MMKELEIDIEKDIVYYLVEVKGLNLEYVVKIDAETGEVFGLKYKIKEDIKENKPVPGDKDKDKDKDKDAQTYITKNRAIEIAIEKIGNKNAKVDDIEFEYDDNPPVYEIEMYDDEYEYEIEIHAITGEILKFEKERD